ncbi:NAD(P)-dependent dehydrogenase (short-subunit alcohol dehydrogenase family) [Streptomyces canus]|uniref:NAD(P)-dependent dehydrogenase (Short-subunit alcohol dehydrogenase family) n=1 Tax=Streptomyces canus TaxID=58343 RepID=A0AAW8F5C7_9ACTN|nr:SDR family oxidoreductase [Streptomyces canus]MDQ0904560.1 NAD(P)-dependent dehydrogenase (short-subunit alcohol dehydrogenase family) [Streptomyces canus]
MTEVLAGKVAVVTGAGSGIGLAIARRFAAEGARVFLAGRRQEPLDAAVAEIGPAATGVRTDVSVQTDFDELYSVVREEAGRIDVLVANAGSAVPQPLGEITEEAIDATFGTNVKGTIFTVQKALPLLSDGASIIVTGSTNALSPGTSLATYGASKAAVRNLVRSWALSAQERKFRVNVLTPGPTETPGLVGAVGPDHQLASQVPLGRIGRPDEIAAVATFLASDASSFVNGVDWFVDGGLAQV